MTTDSLFAWRPLTPRVSLVEGNGANSVVIADGRDVLLVDTKETGFGGALRAEVQRIVVAAADLVHVGLQLAGDRDPTPVPRAAV